MTQAGAEVVILAMNALGAGILMLVAGVAQKIMNELDELEFKRFLNQLDKAAMSDPFAVTIATLPIIAAVFYFLAYGFGHWWFTAGLVVWLVGGTITKVTNMPIYLGVADPRNTDSEELRKQRRKLQLANNARAWLTLGSVALMACQFGVIEVVLAVVVVVIITYPLLLLARRYTRGTARAISG
jgi:hypothetical protein